MASRDSLGDRMKWYEEVPRTSLTPRMPMILRVDGRAFHTYVKTLEHESSEPWNPLIRDGMTAAAAALMREISGAKIAYLQSDEISLLVTDYDTIASQAWFDKVAQKVCSVGASIVTAAFNRAVLAILLGRYHLRELEGADETVDVGKLPVPAHFDARAFVVPREDVCNYFVWREQDATRNSVSMLARAHFDHERLHGKGWEEMQELLFRERGVNWNDCEVWQKRGWCVVRRTEIVTVAELRERGTSVTHDPDVVVDPDLEVARSVIEPDWNIPIFTRDRDYIERHVDLERAERERRSDELLNKILEANRTELLPAERLDPEHLQHLLEIATGDSE